MKMAIVQTGAAAIVEWVVVLVVMAGCGGSTASGPAPVHVVPSGASQSEEIDPADTAAPSPEPAVAERTPDAAARAEAAFEEGRSLFSDGRYEEAAAKFEESLSHDRAVGTLLNLARCRELLGDKAAACAHYAEAESMANDSGQPDRVNFVRAQMAKLGCP